MSFRELFSEHVLSLDRLRAFLDVVDAGSIVKAAGGDPNRQSQYSRQIKELEVFFGATLTTRKGRRITFTEEGERLARLIRSSFESLADFRADSRNEQRRTSVAAGASVIEWLLAPVLAECRATLGNVLMETRTMRSGDVVRALDDGQTDFGIIRSDAVTPSLSVEVIGEIGYSLFAPRSLAVSGNPRSGKAWEQLLSNLPQARLVEGGRLRRAIDEAHEALLIRPQIVAETTSLLQLAALVNQGQCAAILPQTAKSSFSTDEVTAIPLTGFLNYQRKLCLVWQASRLKKRGWGDAQARAIAISLRKRI